MKLIRFIMFCFMNKPDKLSTITIKYTFMKTKLLIFFILILGTGTVHAQRFSLGLSSAIEFAGISPENLETQIEPNASSLGYQLGAYYQWPLNEKFSMESGIRLGYGNLRIDGVLKSDQNHAPFNLYLPIDFIGGSIPVNLLFHRHLSQKTSAIFKGGAFYRASMFTTSKYSYGTDNVTVYRFNPGTMVQHAFGNTVSAGIGQKLSNGSELQLLLVFNFTYNKPIEGDITFMTGTTEEQKGTIYKTGQSLGLEIRYCFNKK